MNTIKLILHLASLLCVAFAAELRAQSTAFTYQGSLTENGTPANSTNDLTFTLYNAAAGGSIMGTGNVVDDLSVSNGLFLVTLNFGATVFDGSELWLEIAVRPGASAGAYTSLSPRQPITGTPYALHASKAGNAATAATAPWAGLTGVPAGFADGIDNDTTYRAGTGLTLGGSTFSISTGGVGTTQLANGAVTIAKLANGAALAEILDDDGAGSGLDADWLDGLDATAFALAAHDHDAVYWKLGGNAGTTPGTHFLGTTDNQPVELKVNNARALRLENNGDGVSDSGIAPDGAPNVIGGSSMNFVGAGVVGATIAGGGATNWNGAPRTNAVLSDYGAIGGAWGIALMAVRGRAPSRAACSMTSPRTPLSARSAAAVTTSSATEGLRAHSVSQGRGGKGDPERHPRLLSIPSALESALLADWAQTLRAFG